ncbi:MAG: acetyltransferase [Candidatus Woesearchaeota archaeon]
MKGLYIIGTGSQARYVIEACSTHRILGLIDIFNEENIGKDINGVKVICLLSDIEKHAAKDDAELVIAFGDNKKKEEIAKILSKKGYDFASIISERAYIPTHCEIGKGCIINPNVTIMPNVKIGNHVIIHSGCVIEHDNEIKDFANIAPRVSTAGNVNIGKGAYVYTGAVIIPKTSIGDNAVVGAGAVVLKDVGDNCIVAGVPAKEIKRG